MWPHSFLWVGSSCSFALPKAKRDLRLVRTVSQSSTTRSLGHFLVPSHNWLIDPIEPISVVLRILKTQPIGMRGCQTEQPLVVMTVPNNLHSVQMKPFEEQQTLNQLIH